jgi:hypothetical protein
MRVMVLVVEGIVVEDGGVCWWGGFGSHGCCGISSL